MTLFPSLRIVFCLFFRVTRYRVSDLKFESLEIENKKRIEYYNIDFMSELNLNSKDADCSGLSKLSGDVEITYHYPPFLNVKDVVYLEKGSYKCGDRVGEWLRYNTNGSIIPFKY